MLISSSVLTPSPHDCAPPCQQISWIITESSALQHETADPLEHAFETLKCIYNISLQFLGLLIVIPVDGNALSLDIDMP